jgi:phosphatidylserine/phosphatidylglycerophosphate/cardiolipin synthase-like enzyme
MPTFEELKQRYMAAGGGGSSGGGAAIPIHTNCSVTPWVQDRGALAAGATYFSRLKGLIDSLSGDGQFIYISGWWLGSSHSSRLVFDGGTSLIDLLKAKSRAGVDVRVMGWVMAPEVIRHAAVQSMGAAYLNVNAETMGFINALRAEASLANKAVLNILSHPAGAVHTKMVIVGSNTGAVGFTGGVDLEQTRQTPIWHDVQAEVQGPVVQSLFDLFRAMWNEVRGRATAAGLTATGRATGAVTCDSHSSGMPDLPSRTLSSPTSARMHVQSARTCPQFNFSTSVAASLAGAGLPSNQPLSFAPSGLFEIKQVWQKGISGAETYIYIEDQAFTSLELFDWINTQLKAKPSLKVILIAAGDDPTAPNPSEFTKVNVDAVNNHLLNGLSSSDISNRVAYCMHTQRGKFIHTKSTLVDDQWALIGSANAMRRSLYTDIEHSVAFMDEAGQAVADYRRELWGTLLNATFPAPADAVAAFFSVPFRGSGTPTTSAAVVERLRLPFPNQTLSADERTMVDEIFDTDSRQAWGSGLISMYMRQQGVGSISP